MKKFFAILFVLLLATSVAFAGTVEKLVGTPKKIALIAVSSDTKINITNPKFLAKYSAGTNAASNKFQVVYHDAGTKDSRGNTYVEVPAAAKAAIDFATAIWSEYIDTSVPIIVRMGMIVLPGPLGWNWVDNESHIKNFKNAPLSDTWYQSSLANAITGSRVAGTADMNIDLSSTITWYYGLDGKGPEDQYDFVTVMLHEITHGLNFAGLIGYAAGQGDRTNVGPYDSFVIDKDGKYLTDYSNGSELGSALTSDALYFAGPNAKAANKGNAVQVYAPTEWKPGSSYSHVGESFRNDGSGNKLMLFSATKGSAIHTPGDVVVGILKDMGWNRGVTPPPPPPSSSGGGCNAAPGLMFIILLAVPAIVKLTK